MTLRELLDRLGFRLLEPLGLVVQLGALALGAVAAYLLIRLIARRRRKRKRKRRTYHHGVTAAPPPDDRPQVHGPQT